LYTPFDKLRTGFDKLRVNGWSFVIIGFLPFVLSGLSQKFLNKKNEFAILSSSRREGWDRNTEP
jgi:hypothetical protein